MKGGGGVKVIRLHAQGYLTSLFRFLPGVFLFLVLFLFRQEEWSVWWAWAETDEAATLLGSSCWREAG